MPSRRPTRRQFRRRARQAHRDGYQPMLMINSDEFPETAFAVITHWLWRYRSELAPITVAIATALAAIVLHHTHPSAWRWLAVATVSAIALLAAPLPAWARKAWGVFERPAERIYITIVVATLGGWLTVATAIPGIGKKSIDPKKLTVRVVQTWLNQGPGNCQCCAQRRQAQPTEVLRGWRLLRGLPEPPSDRGRAEHAARRAQSRQA